MNYTTVDSGVVLASLLELIKEFFIFILPIIAFLAGVYFVWRMIIYLLFKQRLF